MSGVSNPPLPSSGYDYGYGQYAREEQWQRRPRPRRRRIILIVAIVIVLVAVLFLVYLLFVYDGGFSSPGRSGTPFFGFGILSIFLILMIGFMCIRIAMWSTRGRGDWSGGGGNTPPQRRHNPAIAIARQRYARGEITREQFQQIVEDIRHSGR